MTTGNNKLLARLQYCYHRLLRRTLVRSVILLSKTCQYPIHAKHLYVAKTNEAL